MMKHVLDPVPSLQMVLPDSPPAVGDVIAKAMAKGVGERYQTPSAFSEALNGAARTILSRRARRRWRADELDAALDELVEDDE
jgi:hypothetical protein